MQPIETAYPGTQMPETVTDYGDSQISVVNPPEATRSSKSPMRSSEAGNISRDSWQPLSNETDQQVNDSGQTSPELDLSVYDTATDLEDDSDSSNDALRIGDYALNSVSAQSKNDLVERLMGEFWGIFHEGSFEGVRTHGSNSSLTSTYTQGAEAGASKSFTSLTGKRTGDNGNGGPPDERGRRGRKRQRSGSCDTSSRDELRPFACPYRKYNPCKYNVNDWRSCAVTPHGTVARVK